MNEPSRIDAIATHWSLIREAHTAGVPGNAAAARQLLVLRYAKAIRRYIGGILKNAEDADELAQDAVVRRLIKPAQFFDDCKSLPTAVGRFE